jgi:hypothetical protein
VVWLIGGESQIVPKSDMPAAGHRSELAHELLDELRTVDGQGRATKNRIIRIVAASKTSVTEATSCSSATGGTPWTVRARKLRHRPGLSGLRDIE